MHAGGDGRSQHFEGYIHEVLIVYMYVLHLIQFVIVLVCKM